MINYKKLYEKQYGKKKLLRTSLRNFKDLQKFFRKYDWDRYVITKKLIALGEKVLDTGYSHCLTCL